MQPGLTIFHFLSRLIHDIRLGRLELPRRHTPLEQLVNLFQGAPLEFRQEEEEKDAAHTVRRGPNVAILCTLFGCVSANSVIQKNSVS